MRVIFILLMWSAAASCIAQSMHLFKSVHADGTVGYSDTRPETATTVEKMEIQQNSTAIEQQGAQRMQEIESASKRLEKQRADEAQARRKYQTVLAEARQEVSDAERDLTTTQQSKKSATAERIGLAEQRVRLAHQRLREVQSTAPSTAR
jgi:DNA repair exonuclease SbcCD ATPase subunit